MKGAFVLKSNNDSIEEYFDAKTPLLIDWNPKLIINPGDTAMIICQGQPDVINFSTYGMTPSWAKYPMQLIHARADRDKNPDNDPAFNGSKAIFLSKAFRNPLFSKRCIVMANAFIEWSNGIDRRPYLFFLPENKRPFGLAGLFDVWIDPSTEEAYYSFCIITVPANSLLRKIGASRMPVILPRGKESKWISHSSDFFLLFSSYRLTLFVGFIYPQQDRQLYELFSFDKQIFDSALICIS